MLLTLGLCIHGCHVRYLGGRRDDSFLNWGFIVEESSGKHGPHWCWCDWIGTCKMGFVYSDIAALIVVELKLWFT